MRTALVQRARDGDEDAFTQLVDTCGEPPAKHHEPLRDHGTRHEDFDTTEPEPPVVRSSRAAARDAHLIDMRR
jgi:hypothetical protein